MPETMSDREAIQYLYGRYSIEMDRNDEDGVAGCFTDDGEFLVSGTEPARGLDEIRDVVRRTAEGRPLHLTVNPWIKEIDGDVAHCEAYFLMLDPETGQTVAYGTYRDTPIRCADGRWRWKARRVDFSWASDEYLATREPKVVPREAAAADVEQL
jgi:uncharacterized protein (TIGR02246 family)